MRLKFPVIIIDEDFRSENTSGLGIRALAEAIEKEGMEVLGVTSYGDLTSFAQQQAAARPSSCRSTTRSSAPTAKAVAELRAFVSEIRRATPTSRSSCTAKPAPRATSQRHPARAARLHPHVRGHAGVRGAPHHPRSQVYLDGLAPPFFRALMDYARTAPTPGTAPATPAAWPS
jgi:hypothetical protein